MTWFQVPGHADRRVAIVLLVLANSLTCVAMDVLFACTAYGNRGISIRQSMIWLALVLVAGILGQIAVLAFWFSLSRDTFWFRLTILGVTMLAFSLGASITLGQIDPLEPAISETIGSAGYLALSTVQTAAFCMSIFLLAYAILLPLRRLTGISLGTLASEAAIGSNRQFRLDELLIWTTLVIAPLVLVRLATLGQDKVESSDYVSLALFQMPLLIGWPIFQAVLARRRAWLWTLGTFASFAAGGWVLSEIPAWIDAPGSTSLGQLGIGRIELFVLTFGGIIALNTCVLRALGFRLLRERDVPSP